MCWRLELGCGAQWCGSARGGEDMSQVCGVRVCMKYLHVCVASVKVSVVSAHMWQRLTYVACLNVHSQWVWYPHMFWGGIIDMVSAHVCGRG